MKRKNLFRFVLLAAAVAIFFLPFLVFPQSAGDLQNQINSTQAENNQLQTRADQLRGSNSELRARIEALGAKVAALQTQQDNAAKKNKELRWRLSILQKGDTLKKLKGLPKAKPEKKPAARSKKKGAKP